MTKSKKRFPLSLSGNGHYCKRINGKHHYFGKDREAALKKYKAERADLEAGRLPRQQGKLSVADMVEDFMESAAQRVELGLQGKKGGLSPLSFKDYHSIGKLMVEILGENSDPEQLQASQFKALWLHLALTKKYADCRITKSVIIVRMIFKWAYESDLIQRIPKFGPEFKAAGKRDARETRKVRMLPAAGIRDMLEKADPQQKAMILLGINGGLGNNDISELRPSAIQGEWLVYPRPKTKVKRRIPLWPETVEALQVMRQGKERVFETVDGTPMITTKPTGERVCRITVGFKKLLGKMYEKGIGFYVLRHVFQTIGDGARDPIATSAIMGHVDASMAGNYREHFDDARLIAVTEHVRSWLFTPSDVSAEPAVASA